MIYLIYVLSFARLTRGKKGVNVNELRKHAT